MTAPAQEAGSTTLPGIGRIVHVVSGEKCLAAIVTDFDQEDDSINVTVFDGHGQTFGAVGIVKAQHVREPFTWHWPERASS